MLGDWATGAADCFGGAATDPAAPLPSLAGAPRPWRWSIGLGVRRLAIRDPDPRARQPMPGRRGLWLAFNGEVYNADAIRDELRGAGRVFRSDGDTEVFLAAWETWGPDALTRLSGMWAFAVWDAPRRRLWCGRDPLGIKPLYLARTPSGVLVASTPARDRRRARRASVAARRDDRRVPRHRPARSRRADVLQRHRPDRRRLPARDRRHRRRGAPLGAGPGGDAVRATATASRASTTRSIAPSPAIAPATGRPAPCSAAASTARRSCSAPPPRRRRGRR